MLGGGSLLGLSTPAERHHRKPAAENHVINQELNKTGDDIQHNGKTVFCDGGSFVSFLPSGTIQAREVSQIKHRRGVLPNVTRSKHLKSHYAAGAFPVTDIADQS